jgi:hypothetical protein
MGSGKPFLRPDSRGKQYGLVDTGCHHCLTKFCRNVVDKKKSHSPYCSKCRSRRWKSAHPLHYSYKQLRNDAKRRQKEFSLTRDQYIAFARQTGYDERKGRGATFLSIDRRDSSKGYSADNIRALTVRANSARVRYVTNMPAWLRDEIAAAESGGVPESHKTT